MLFLFSAQSYNFFFIYANLFAFLFRFELLCSKRIVFLPEITDGNRHYCDEHLARSGIPTQYLYAQFETEIIDCQIDGDNHDIAYQLPPAIQPRCRKSDVFLQPETGQQCDWKHDTQRRDMRSNRLRKCPMSNIKCQINYLVPDDEIVDKEIEHPVKN